MEEKQTLLLKLEKSETRMESVEKDNIERNAILTYLSKEKQNFKLKLEKSENRITSLEKDNIEFNAKLTSLLEEKRNLKPKLEKSEKRITSIEKNNIELYAKLTSLKEDKQKVNLNLEKSEKRITALDKDVTELNTDLRSESEKAQAGLSDINTFVKDFYKNFTITRSVTNKHDSAIHCLYNFTNDVNKNIVNVENNQTQMFISINQRIDATQGCQAGYDVGGDSHPAHAFPSARTVEFNPPFKNIPALSYGTTMIDTTSHLKLRLELLSLTTESFTVHFHTWGKYALYAAKFSWMACPK